MRQHAAVLVLGWMLIYSSALAASTPRNVVIGGDIAEIIATLGASETLVGRDDTTLYPQTLQSLPSVGYLRQLAAEGVLSLRPERLLVSAQAGPREVLAQLESSGVEVIRIEADNTLDDIPRKVQQVGTAMARHTAAEELNIQLAESLVRIDALPALDRGPVLFLLSHTGTSPMVAGQDTAAHNAIQAAGVSNAFATLRGYRQVSGEGLIAAAPTAVIATRAGLDALGGAAALWRLPGLDMTPAGRSRQLVVCDDQALLGFGPRTPEAILALHAALRGDMPSDDHAMDDNTLCQRVDT